jgi:hypothetical protein
LEGLLEGVKLSFSTLLIMELMVGILAVDLRLDLAIFTSWLEPMAEGLLVL